ncbi:hypothetical protein SEA_TOMAS_268 [Streptomyces phage Tomas]|uniref:Uncharacterized protein n=1 Tax=Streptomyces phage Tomas TaxID=2914443 RepID=A0AA49H1V0_9CAUD|nr:hypothetical protein PP453_gp012 [Streptomyces phage Tomas]YP_010651350.1 hypothetical protein PP453_gp056 [Streptomyces phage Tomas]UMO76203.1 hypothetical protein SEA_TOMAS_12 [Streptomyces phage Tomas]UMO76411.1 hypothetical protein SEA_TOMAS_268 [Streptomyces phage Tomas]
MKIPSGYTIMTDSEARSASLALEGENFNYVSAGTIKNGEVTRFNLIKQSEPVRKVCPNSLVR